MSGIKWAWMIKGGPSFTGDVKLKALRVIGGDNGQHPLELRLYEQVITHHTRSPHLTFTGIKIVRQWDLMNWHLKLIR